MFFAKLVPSDFDLIFRRRPIGISNEFAAFSLYSPVIGVVMVWKELFCMFKVAKILLAYFEKNRLQSELNRRKSFCKGQIGHYLRLREKLKPCPLNPAKPDIFRKGTWSMIKCSSETWYTCSAERSPTTHQWRLVLVLSRSPTLLFPLQWVFDPSGRISKPG